MNVLIVGTGSFGRLRGAAFARRGHAVAFVSRDLERARAATLAVSGPLERATDALEASLSWARGVFVASPPALHTGSVLQAARAGKAVLVEKPVEATLERAHALRDALGEHARLVSVAENYRFLPQLPLVRERLPSIASAAVVLHRPRAPRGWRVEQALSGGGVLADMGVHYVHLLRLLLGELTVERALERARVSGVDGAFSLEGSSEGGARWSIDLSWLSWRRRSSVTLTGSKGTIRFRVGKRALWRKGWLGVPSGRQLVPAGDEYGQEALHDDWLAATERGAPAIALDEGIRDLAVVDAAYRLAHLPGPR